MIKNLVNTLVLYSVRHDVLYSVLHWFINSSQHTFEEEIIAECERIQFSLPVL